MWKNFKPIMKPICAPIAFEIKFLEVFQCNFNGRAPVAECFNCLSPERTNKVMSVGAFINHNPHPRSMNSMNKNKLLIIGLQQRQQGGKYFSNTCTREKPVGGK